MNKIILLINLSFIIVSFISCFAIGTLPQEIDKNYYNTLEKLTKVAKIYENFETKLVVYATYKDLEFRKMYIEKLSNDLMISENEKYKLLQEEEKNASQFNEFLVIVYTSERKKNNLHLKDAPWNIFLLNNRGELLTPIKIERELEDPNKIFYFYPYVNIWSYTYKIIFPKFSNEAENFKMIITSIFGKCELNWDIK